MNIVRISLILASVLSLTPSLAEAQNITAENELMTEEYVVIDRQGDWCRKYPNLCTNITGNAGTTIDPEFCLHNPMSPLCIAQICAIYPHHPICQPPICDLVPNHPVCFGDRPRLDLGGLGLALDGDWGSSGRTFAPMPSTPGRTLGNTMRIAVPLPDFCTRALWADPDSVPEICGGTLEILASKLDSFMGRNSSP